VSDDAPRWFDDDEPSGRSRRLPLLVLAAVVPWAVLAVVLVRAPGTTPTDRTHAAVTPPSPATADDQPVAPDDQPVAPETPSGTTDAAGDDTAAAADTSADAAPLGPGAGHDHRAAEGDDPPEVPADHPTRVAHGVAEALVVAVTRAWLSDAGPDLHVDGVEVDRTGYLEHVAVERIELDGDDLAVATVSVIVLERDAERYTDVALRRAAVPLRVTPTTVHPAGPPWWLPTPPDLVPRPPDTEPLADPELVAATVETLTQAGYRDPAVDSLAVTGGGTLIAEVVAATPAGEQLRGPVWLRIDADGRPVVLGHHEDAAT
jgi:hypothetical protein